MREKITSSIKRVARRCKMNAFWKGKTAYKATDAYEIPDDVVKSALIDGLDSSVDRLMIPCSRKLPLHRNLPENQALKRERQANKCPKDQT